MQTEKKAGNLLPRLSSKAEGMNLEQAEKKLLKYVYNYLIDSIDDENPNEFIDFLEELWLTYVAYELDGTTVSGRLKDVYVFRMLSTFLKKVNEMFEPV